MVDDHGKRWCWFTLICGGGGGNGSSYPEER